MNAFRKHHLLEMVRFVSVGLLATGLHYGLYLALEQILPVNLAYTLGYLLSFLANFWLTARFTFQAAPSWKRFTGMAGAHGVNYMLHMLLLNLFIALGVPAVWVPFPVFGIAIPVNFLLVRFVFRH